MSQLTYMHASNNKVSKNRLYEFAGREKTSQDGTSGALTPCFVNNDYAPVERIHSTVHACPEVLSWPRAGQRAPESFTAKDLAAAALGRPWSDT